MQIFGLKGSMNILHPCKCKLLPIRNAEFKDAIFKVHEFPFTLIACHFCLSSNVMHMIETMYRFDLESSTIYPQPSFAYITTK